MIVFEKDETRNNNYTHIMNIMGKHIFKFPAIDTINNYDYWKSFALDNKYTTQKYIDEICDDNKGKLGCNLSHQLLLNYIYENHKPHMDSIKGKEIGQQWHMIMEDDVGIKGDIWTEEFEEQINKLLAANLNTKYIQMCIYDNFIIPQSVKAKVYSDTKMIVYPRIPQFGTCCYLIHIDMIKYIVEQKTIGDNIDFYYNTIGGMFEATACMNNYFISRGYEDRSDARNDKKKFGSLIWNVKNEKL